MCLTGVFLCTQAAAENMVANKYGKIVNIASVGGLMAFPGASVQDAAKARIRSLAIGLTGANVDDAARLAS